MKMFSILEGLNLGSYRPEITGEIPCIHAWVAVFVCVAARFVMRMYRNCTHAFLRQEFPT